MQLCNIKTWRIEMCPGSHSHFRSTAKDSRGHGYDYSHNVVLNRTLLMIANIK